MLSPISNFSCTAPVSWFWSKVTVDQTYIRADVFEQVAVYIWIICPVNKNGLKRSEWSVATSIEQQCYLRFYMLFHFAIQISFSFSPLILYSLSLRLLRPMMWVGLPAINLLIFRKKVPSVGNTDHSCIFFFISFLVFLAIRKFLFSLSFFYFLARNNSSHCAASEKN